jgi:hypothetical protein
VSDDFGPDELWIPPAREPTLIFSFQDYDPNTCGVCGRPGGANREHDCLNEDGSSVYFRAQNAAAGLSAGQEPTQ